MPNALRKLITACQFAALLPAVQSASTAATARYRHERDAPLPASVVRTFSLATGPAAGGRQWLYLEATKAGGEQYRFWLLGTGYPRATLREARSSTVRYIFQEGSSEPREYRNRLTGKALLPTIGGWEYLIPRPGGLPDSVRYLGHRYVRDSLGKEAPPEPAAARVVELRTDLLIGPASNTRQKDETRRYDDSDYELVRMTRDDYRAMAQAGVSCVAVDAEQAQWAEELNLFYWGAGAKLPFPEFLYRTQYLGPALFLDEPAVGTRDHVLRPRLEKDEAFRKSITPQAAFDAFREYYGGVLKKGAPLALMRTLGARKDVDIGDMHFTQENLYTWETMVSTAAYQLSQDPLAPEAFVFEPPGRIGTRRTIPEMNMTYGTALPAGDPSSLTGVVFGFLRGAARATDKSWGVSIYGAVQRADTFFWLTHAYDLGATRFHFWDNYRLACVPFNEVLALSRHLTAHAAQNPHRDLAKLRGAAETAILLPPGYDLGHVQMGKGNLWGVGELNLERVNQRGVKYRVVMSNFFAEVERCHKSGVAFDALWDLPEVVPKGYREVVRIREDGKVEVNGSVVDSPRRAPQPSGVPPGLSISITSRAGTNRVEVAARARVEERSAPVYYTLGADTEGVYHNAMVAWELYGPGEEDYRYLAADRLKPRVRRTGFGGEVEMDFTLDRAGNYRLRAATVDTAGRSTVVWKNLAVSRDPASGSLTARVMP